MKKVITLVALVVTAFSYGMAQTCDTLTNLQSAIDTATLIPADTGFISGNNSYGDAAVAEAFPVNTSDTFLTTAIINFGSVTINSTDTNSVVTIYAWDNAGTSVFGTAAPGNAFDSAWVTLGQIATAVSENKGLLVHFTNTFSLSATDTVFVGVVFPTVTGDTVSVLTNTFNGPDGDGYVLALDPSQDGAYTWDTYNDNYGITSGSLGNYIGVVMCTAPNNNIPYGYFTSTPPTNANNNYTISGCTPFTVAASDFSSPPAPTYEAWIFGDGNITSGLNASDAYTTPGIYNLVELVSNDTGSVVEVFVPFYITVEAVGSPAVTATIIPASTDSTADGEAYVTVASPTGFYFTYWYDSTGVGNNLLAFGDTLDGVSNGLYIVNVQDQDGCAVNDSVFVEPLTTGIIKVSPNMQVNVYPNPATDVLNLVWGSNANAEVSVVDLNGNVLSTLITNGGTKTVYDIHDLASGAYILRITDKASGQQQSRLFTKF